MLCLGSSSASAACHVRRTPSACLDARPKSFRPHAPHSQKQTRSVGKKEPSLCYLLQADPAGAPAVQWLSAEAAALLVDGEAMRMRKTSAGRVSALAVACQSQPTHAACCAVRATRAACILCVVMLLVCSLARPCCLFITVDTIAIPTPATSAPGLGWLVTVRVTAKRRIRFFLQPATSTTHWRTIVGSRWPPPLRIWTKCKACSASAL